MKKIYKTDVRVPYAHTDAMGIVHHTNYINYFEIARTEFLREEGYPYSILEKQGIWLPIKSVYCEYKSPARYDDLLTINTWVEELKSATVIMAYEINRKETGELIAKGTTKHPITDNKLKPLRLREAHPEIYEIFNRAMNSVKHASY
jgi:acyl-CoA thioester hydrolase